MVPQIHTDIPAEIGPPEPCVLFDEAHGQVNWRQTGFSSRQRTTTFSGLARILEAWGLNCCSVPEPPLLPLHGKVRLLVLPPATGQFDLDAEVWTPRPNTLYSAEEIDDILGYVSRGGSLLAFGYRFGDSFTHANLGQITAALGCPLNDDAIVDLAKVRRPYPLESMLDTGRDGILLSWAAKGVGALRWRCQATFSILPGATAWPLVVSQGGRCLTYHRGLREVCFQSSPMAVVGRFGRGRFGLFGGPHAFEDSEVGLLREADNARFLANVLEWLLQPRSARADFEPEQNTRSLSQWESAIRSWRPICRATLKVERQGIEAIEKILHETRIFRALSREVR